MADGSIKIAIEVDGKQVDVSSKSLDNLEKSGQRSGKGIEAAEKSMDSLSDSSSRAGSSVKDATSAIDGLGDSGSQTGKDLKGADGALDALADSSSDASAGVQGVSNSLDNVSSEANEAASDLNKAKNETEGVGKQSNNASGNIKKFATALGLVAIGAAAFNTLKSSMDAAITRFDTLNSFPKVLQALGVSAEDSERAMSRLSDGIDGLPTTLNDIAGSAQRLYTSFNDMDKATDTAIALNNALLGSGSSAEEAKRGTDQYIKALQTGTMNMDTWNTLSETMDVGLIKIAEGFGFAGKTAKDDLYKALQDNTIQMEDFNDKLIEVGTGTGIMAKLAKENSLGIATSLGNLRNAAAKGIADIIDSFNKLSQKVTGKDIAQNIDSLKAVVNASFKAVGSAIEKTTPIIIFFADGVKLTISVVEALTPAIIGLMSAYGAYIVITKASNAIKASNATLTVVMASTEALTLATRANTTATVVNAGAVKLSTLAIGVMTGTIKLSTAAKVVATAATNAFGVALRFLSGPIGWVTLGIGALVGAVVGIVKWFRRSTEEAKQLKADTEELGEASNKMTDSLNSTSEAYKESQKDIKATAEANQDLANRIGELAEKENKSAAEKQMLANYIDQLNGSVEGLNLAYNEEANALSMSSEELQARVDLMKEQEASIAAQERLLEISKEQSEIDQQLKEINKLKEESVRLEEEGAITKSNHKDAIADLEEQEKTLTETKAQLAEQQVETEAQLTSSMEAITEATKNGVSNQKIAFEDLSESQQATIESMKSTWQDYKDAATDMFDTLSDKAELSVSEMTSNLEENQRIIGEWSENIAELAERGVDEGLLNTLREAGPESAGHVNALVNASDEELAKLSEAFAKGGDTATDALSKSLGIEESGVMEAVGHLVTDTEQSLSQQIESADFKSIGNAVPEGLAEGIKGGSKDAEGASKKMSDDTTKAAKEALGVHSPSRVFKEIGTNVTEGLALGINQGTSNVTQAIQKMFKSIQDDSNRSFRDITKNYDNSVKQIDKSLDRLPKITQEAMKNMLDRLISGASSQMIVMKNLASNLPSWFNDTPSRFRSIGLDAMAGLNSGLNAGRGRVMSTARSIANSVASTMKKALDIHSPSRRMKNEVGKWIPEGIALGIRDNAKSVYKELDSLSNNMIITSTPEQAIGASRMAYSSGSQFVDAIKNIQLPTASMNSNGTASLLKEQNRLLGAILNKNQDLYISGEKVTDIVNENNAILATLNIFD